VAARKAAQLEDNVGVVDLLLSDEEVLLLDAGWDPGIPYPKWMVRHALSRFEAPSRNDDANVRRQLRKSGHSRPRAEAVLSSAQDSHERRKVPRLPESKQ
jgi:hypothetical protein